MLLVCFGCCMRLWARLVCRHSWVGPLGPLGPHHMCVGFACALFGHTPLPGGFKRVRERHNCCAVRAARSSLDFFDGDQHCLGRVGAVSGPSGPPELWARASASAEFWVCSRSPCIVGVCQACFCSTLHEVVTRTPRAPVGMLVGHPHLGHLSGHRFSEHPDPMLGCKLPGSRSRPQDCQSDSGSCGAARAYVMASGLACCTHRASLCARVCATRICGGRMLTCGLCWPSARVAIDCGLSCGQTSGRGFCGASCPLAGGALVHRRVCIPTLAFVV